MSRLRTANLLGALSDAVSGRLVTALTEHLHQSSSAAAALHLIGVFDGCTNLQLSQALRLSQPATVRLLDKLEAVALVRRTPSANDGRAVALSLTDAGRVRAQAALEARCAALEPIIDLLSAEQCRQLDDVAETVLAGMTRHPSDSRHICRLCDETICPPDDCPVHSKAIALLRSA